MMDDEWYRFLRMLPECQTRSEAEARTRFLNAGYVVAFFASPSGAPISGYRHVSVDWATAAADQAYFEYTLGYGCAVVPANPRGG